MTLRSRLLGLVTILALLAMAPSTFAQVTITISEDQASTSEVATSRNAQTAQPGNLGSGLAVTGSIVAGNTTTTRLFLTYPSTITSSSGLVSTSISSSTGASGLCGTYTGSSTSGPVIIGNAILSGPSGLQTPMMGEVACFTGTRATLVDITTATSAPVAGGIPSNDPIRIISSSGLFRNVSNPVVNTTSKRIEIVLPNSSNLFAASGTNSAETAANGFFKLVGVRLDANGLTGAQSVTPSIDNLANGYQLGSGATTVISNIADGITSSGLAIGAKSGAVSQGTATVFTNRAVPKATGSFIVTEGFASAWRTITDNSSNLIMSAGNATKIRLSFGSLPSGITITLNGGSTTLTGSGSILSPPTASLSATAVTSLAPSVVLTVTNESLSATDTYEIDYSVGTPSSTAVLTANVPITVTATLFPIGDGLTTSFTSATAPQGIAREDQGYPAFQQKDIGPITIVNVVPASTTMLLPFALALGPYDTAITVANTTADQFGSQGATPTPGTLKFDFFPTPATGTATPFSLTTSATTRPGTGLASDGTLAAGATFTDTLSDLLRVAGAPSSFTGYIFITTGFLDAHGTSYISADGFKTNTLNSIGVLPPPATQSRNTPANSVESMGF